MDKLRDALTKEMLKRTDAAVSARVKAIEERIAALEKWKAEQ